MKMSHRSSNTWIHRGFKDFARGRFDCGGANLYVNAKGIIETIHRTDIDNDGYVDIVLANTHGNIERGPTWIYKPSKGKGKDWEREELPNDSGWMSRIVDLDGDGYNDLIVANCENGVTSELPSYVYWGGPDGLTGQRTELPTVGAYDVAAIDVNSDGRLDLIFSSAWVDHHCPGQPRVLTVYVQTQPRSFENMSERYGLTGIAATAIACADLTGNGRADLVVGNYRCGFEYDTDSFIYWATENGFDTASPLHLPGHAVQQVLLADLNGDGRKEIIFCGGNQVWIYWNDQGRFGPDNRLIIEAKGFNTLFCAGALRAEVADVDGDGKNELILATEQGVEIRRASDLQTVEKFLPLPYASWVSAADLDGDGRPELIVSKYDNRVTYETESAIFWNSPDGFSSDRASWVPTTGAMGNTSGDLDGDGRPEVVFNNTMRGPSTFDVNLPVYIYRGSKKADYGVHRRLELPSGGDTYGYVMADLDADGYAELVLTTGFGLRIFPGGPQGPKPDRYVDLRFTQDYLHNVMEVHVADFNGDGYLDLLAIVQTYDDKPETMAKSSVIFYGSPEGFSVDRSENLPTYSCGKGRLVDIDQDGYLDIIICDKRGHLLIFLGGPEGYSLQRTQTIPVDDKSPIGCVNAADLTKNGWLDLIVSIQSHYSRRQTSFYVFYGGPNGYSPKNSQCYRGGYTTAGIAIADIDNDGNLELLVPAYSTNLTRELPAQILHIRGKDIDFENPLNLPANSLNAFMALDLNGNGYLDLVAACHRNDLGHQVDSLIYWNGPEGISADRTTALPGLGPHFFTSRDPGNSYTREPTESYFSPPFDTQGQRPIRIHWEAEIPRTTELRFQLRWSQSEEQLGQALWQGPQGEGTYYLKSGQEVPAISDSARWLQYHAVFVSPNNCLSPRLREVRVEFVPKR